MTSLPRTNLHWSGARTPVWRWGEGNNPTTWGLPLRARLLTLMAEAQPHSCLSRLLLTPLFIPGRIDFPGKLSDMKGLLALWCQHSVIPLSVFLYSVSGTLFSPLSFFNLFFSTQTFPLPLPSPGHILLGSFSPTFSAHPEATHGVMSEKLIKAN